MKRLASISIVIGLVIAVTCTATIFYGRALSAPDSLAQVGLTACGDSPCFMGIIPGVTAWSAALARFATVSSTIDGNQLEFITDEQLDVYLIRSENQALVSAVSIIFPNPSTVDAGALVAQFGLPCGMTINRRLRHVTMEYPAMLAALKLAPGDPTRGFIDTRTTLVSLTVRSGWNQCE